MTKQNIVEMVLNLMGENDSIELGMDNVQMKDMRDHIHKSRTRLKLSEQGICVEFDTSNDTVIFSRIWGNSKEEKTDKRPEKKKVAKEVMTNHSYVIPKFKDDVMTALLDEVSNIIWFQGPTGSGKTVLAQHIAKELGRPLYQINCHGDMGEADFFGERTIVIDELTGQNKIEFQEGIVLKAMQEGLDEEGNEVGNAGILFIDEAGALPVDCIALNRLFESDDPRRTVRLNRDGGRIVRSHSQFRIILSSNTNGRGVTDLQSSQYTAQMDALDISFLSRVDFDFKFGYSKSVEQNIMCELIGDDAIICKISDFKTAVRDNIRVGRLSTPFSTRRLISICKSYRIYKDLVKAINYSVFGKLLPEEIAVYNELCVAKLGIDVLKDSIVDDFDYM